MNIENKTHDEIENILYRYYLNEYIKDRNDAIKLLKNKNFNELRNEYSGYINKKEFSQQLDCILISDVINELQNFIAPENCDVPRIETEKKYNNNGEFITIIVITWYHYEIIEISKCESIAKHWASDNIWRIKNQVGYKQTKQILEMIDKI